MVSTAVFGPGNGPMFLDEVQCSGVEDGLLECAHMGFGNHVCGQAAMQGKIRSKNDVAIMCSAIPKTKKGQPQYPAHLLPCVQGVA